MKKRNKCLNLTQVLVLGSSHHFPNNPSEAGKFNKNRLVQLHYMSQLKLKLKDSSRGIGVWKARA